MKLLEVWRQTRNSPVGLMAKAMFFTFGTIGTYKLIIKPRLDTKKKLEAEAYANYIFDKEQSKLSSE